MLIAQHSCNSRIDERNRLVHESDVTTQATDELASGKPEAFKEEPVQHEAVAVPTEFLLSRRSTRTRRKPKSFGS